VARAGWRSRWLSAGGKEWYMGINRLEVTLALGTTAALVFTGTGCQHTSPVPTTVTVRPAQAESSESELLRASYQPTTLRADHGTIRQPSGDSYLPPHALPGGDQHPPAPLPHELLKTMHPAYILEPPDTLIIDAIRLVPRPPYRIEALDVLVIQVAETLPNQPVSGAYPVSPEGTINLGYGYGVVRVAGLTLEQAIVAVKNQLRTRINNPEVAMALAYMRAIQQIRGEHVIGQDGSVTLGSYGCVSVTGMTVSQAKLVIERHLARWFLNPDISLAVNGYNSKVYYLIFDGGGYGQQIVSLPITGNETVLDGIAKVGGLPPVSSRRKIWVARPTPKGCYQLLPVNWEAITKGADPDTNWQLFPGDRIYVSADPLITVDNAVAKILQPIERVLGVGLLTGTTIESFRNNHNFNGF
jgi:polysaccharide export outer membrane protein